MNLSITNKPLSQESENSRVAREARKHSPLNLCLRNRLWKHPQPQVNSMPSGRSIHQRFEYQPIDSQTTSLELFLAECRIFHSLKSLTYPASSAYVELELAVQSLLMLVSVRFSLI